MARGEITGIVFADGVSVTAGTAAPTLGYSTSLVWAAETSKGPIDVSSFTSNARTNIWQLLDTSGADYMQIDAEITTPSATTVTVTVGIPLTGTYTLVGK